MDLFSEKAWEDYDAVGVIQQRLQLVKRIIPQDVKSILDAGCGNGVITNALDGEYDIVGLDFSEAALAHVSTPKVLASVTAMPFEDKSFDLAMCNEVLEHLSTSELLEAVAELKRCARKYILVSVPNAEQLEFSLIKCKACNEIYHPYGHRQSIGLKRLDGLFQLSRLSHRTLGPWQARAHLPLLKYRQETLNQWFYQEDQSPCPKCGNSGSQQQKTLASKLINALNRYTTIPRRYWLMALYTFDKADTPDVADFDLSV